VYYFNKYIRIYASCLLVLSIINVKKCLLGEFFHDVDLESHMSNFSKTLFLYLYLAFPLPYVEEIIRLYMERERGREIFFFLKQKFFPFIKSLLENQIEQKCYSQQEPRKIARGTFKHYGLQQWLVTSYIPCRSSLG